MRFNQEYDMKKNMVARELVVIARLLTAAAKGTMEVFSNREGGSFTLRKLFGTMGADKVAAEAKKIQDEFVKDLTGVAKEVAADAEISPVEAEVSGFSQGGYFQIHVRVSKLGTDGWQIIDAMNKKGYRSKR